MNELRAIRAEMLEECGGDIDGLFRAIKACEEELVRRGRTIVSRATRKLDGHAPNSA
jgi:hypothetical protein